MKHQLQTIRAGLETATCYSMLGVDAHSVQLALTALTQLEAMVGAQEPVAMLHDDGYWTPMKTEAGRALNDRLMRAGSPSIDVYAAPVAQHPQTEPDDETLKERDDAEDFIDMLLDEVLGTDRPEWTSAYGRDDALRDVQERMTALHKPTVDKAWDRFEKAQQPQADTCQMCGDKPHPGCNSEFQGDKACRFWPAPDSSYRDDNYWRGWNAAIKFQQAEAVPLPPQVMVDMVPPATARDRWMYEQGRLAERDPRTHAAPQQAEAVPSDVVRDAERYRWLRDGCCEGYPSGEGSRQKDAYLVITGYDDLYPMTLEQKDAAIDAAIAQQKGSV